MKKGEEMNVTRQTLRDMILAEIESLDEDGLVSRTSGHGLTGQELATMPAEDVEGILRQKAGGLSSKMAKFISTMVDAGWDRDQLIRNLASMDDDVLVTLLAPAMRESYDRAVLLLVETVVNISEVALKFNETYRKVVDGAFPGQDSAFFSRLMGLYQVYVERKLRNELGSEAELSDEVEAHEDFKQWTSDELEGMSDTFKEAFKLSPEDPRSLYVAWVTDYGNGWNPELASVSTWLRSFDPERYYDTLHIKDYDRIKRNRDESVIDDDPEEILLPTQSGMGKRQDETVLMTVGQFRRLVREAATWSRKQATDYSVDLADRIAKLPDGESKTKLAADLALAGDTDDFDAINAELMELEPSEWESDPHRDEEQYQADNAREDGNYLLNDLLAKFSASKILKGLRNDVYVDKDKEAFVAWLTGDDRPVGGDQEELLRDWLNHIGPHEALEDLDLLSRTLLGASLSERIDKAVNKFLV